MKKLGCIASRGCKILFFTLAWLLFAANAHANSYQPTKEKAIFTISGEISSDISAGIAELGYDSLEKIGVVDIQSHTHFSEEQQKFSGVLMRDLLAFIGAKGESVQITALNDYSVEIPTSDFEKYDVLLAFKVNDEKLSVRELGPTRIIYPIALDAKMEDHKYEGRSIWQIKSMSVK